LLWNKHLGVCVPALPDKDATIKLVDERDPRV
jgi:hypothetical protein